MEPFKKLINIFIKLTAVGLFVGVSLVVAATVNIDSSVHGTATSHHGASSTVVFTNDQTGYSFYRDSTGSCVYSKTNDGGGTWSIAATVDSQTDCVKIAVWYDRWTPGDSGNYIHIVTLDTGSSELWYTSLDTTSDTLSTAVDATGLLQNPTIAIGTNIPSITKATDGTLYMGTIDVSDSFIIRCSLACTLGASWTEAGTNPFDADEDWLLLMPLESGGIMAIVWDISANQILSKTFNGLTWDSSWATIDATATENGTYIGGFGATVDISNNDIFLAYYADVGSLGTDDDIRTAKYSGGIWTAGANVLTNDSKGVTGAKIAIDENSGDIYVIYSARTTPGTASSTNLYYKVSSDDMTSWASEQGPVNDSAGNFYGARVSISSSERIYATWADSTVDDIFGNTIADLVVPEITLSSTGSQTTVLAVPSDSNSSGGAFLLTRSAGSATVGISQITISESGTIPAQTDLTNIELYYETLSGSCSFDGNESLFGSVAAFNGSEQAVVSGSLSVGSTQVCLYVVYNVEATASDGDTIELEIDNPSTEVIVSVGTVTPATSIEISGTTTLTTNQAPDIPTNQAPANATTVSSTLSPVLIASDFSDADLDTFAAAHWQLSGTGNFSSPLWNSGDTTATGNITVGITLENSTTYYWRVRYKDSAGLYSDYSNATSFTISNEVPEQPINESPSASGTVITLTPLLQASAFSDPEGDEHAASQWQVDTSTGFSSPVYDYTSSSAEIMHSISAGNLSNLTTYYWRVRYRDDFVSSHWSEYSNATSFITGVTALAVEARPIFGKNSVVLGETVPLDVQVVNYSTGAPILDATVTLNIFDPDGTLITSGTGMTYVSGSNGTYRYMFSTSGDSGVYLYEVTAQSDGQTGYASANLHVVNTSIDVLSASLDTLVGAFIVSQATVNDATPSATLFITTLSNSTNNFYKNAVLTFTSGDLDGQSRRISDYDGATKTVTLEPALTSVPVSGNAFTVVAQNVRVEEMVYEHEAAEASFRTSVTGSLTTMLASLSTIDASILDLQSSVNTIRGTQEHHNQMKLSDVTSVQQGSDYRVKLYILNEEFLPIDADSAPLLTIYDSGRSIAQSSASMTELMDGVYEYVFSVPDSAVGGLWETIVIAEVDGNEIEQNDYWTVTGSPAQVLISNVDESGHPDISANIIITNEGNEAFEYQYEWCVVTTQDNECGGADDVSYSSAAKLIDAGEDFVTELTSIVPDLGDYYFKLVVYFGGESSAATQFFTIGDEADSESASSVAGGTPSPVENESVVDYSDLERMIREQTEKLNRLISITGGIDDRMPELFSSIEASTFEMSSVKDMQNRLSELSAISVSVKRLIENNFSKPIVESYMMFNSVEIYFLITNPLDTSQYVEFKSYLPKGVKPEDIIEIDGLDVNYDYDPSVQSYYVHGNILLGPRESITKKIEMQDIWVIDLEELFATRNEAKSLAADMSGTGEESSSKSISDEIDEIVSEIVESQESSYISPQLHIAAYESNLEKMQEIKDMMLDLDQSVLRSGKGFGFVGSISGISLSPLNIGLIIVVATFILSAGFLYFLYLWRRSLDLLGVALERNNKQATRKAKV